MTNFPEEQCKKKLKLYHLYKELEELSGDIIVPSLLNHFQRESADFHRAGNFSDEFWADKKKRSKYFMYKNTIDALMWLYVKEEQVTETQEQVTETQELPVKDGFVNSGFVFSTGKTCNLLKVTASDLSAFRSTNELVEDVDYIRQKKKDGTTAKYAPYLYNIEKTCVALYNISYEELRQPRFDLEKHKREETRKVFDSINK
tara:strand:+ start:4216 stop:4821 length:606 start_codon:yes stop_codon:yes gene_type:complete